MIGSSPAVAPSTKAAVEHLSERAYRLLQEYVEALHAAQASHEAFDWIRAGSIFKRYAAAVVAEDAELKKRPCEQLSTGRVDV